jgi:thiol-disulfide isomerase/thioredoxin
MRKLLPSLFVATALALAATSAMAQGLGPGSPAPALDVKAWYKGTPVNALERGKTYVVEFWATWCGPCKTSIPHVTKLAKANPDVTFLGISIWEPHDTAKIKAFVDEMGDKMDYVVGYSGDKEGMSQTWMRAASQNGIPAAFIVKDGVIEWVGHPMEMDQPLAQVKAGTFDRAAFKVKFDKEAAEAARSMEVNAGINEAGALYDKGKVEEARTRLTAVEAKFPEAKSSGDRLRFDWLSREDEQAWKKKVASMVRSKNEGDLRMVLSFALRQSRPKGRVALGEYALNEAVKATKSKDSTVLNYAATFYETLKRTDEALALLKKLEALVPSMPKDEQDDWRESIAKRRAALEKSKAASN